jgi:hypothetical protein
MRHRGWAVLLLVPAALDAVAPRQSGDVLSSAASTITQGIAVSRRAIRSAAIAIGALGHLDEPRAVALGAHLGDRLAARLDEG